MFAEQLAGDRIVEHQQPYFRYSSQGCSGMTLYGYARVSVREPEEANGAVEVLERLDGRLSVRHEGRIIASQEAPPSPV